MAALVQTISQPISTVTMLQTRPASSSGTFSSQSNQKGGTSRGGNYLQYRPSTSTTPYALNQIPGNNQNPLRQHPISSSRFDNRSMSAPSVPAASVSNASAPSSKVSARPDTQLRSDPNRLSLLSTSLDLSLIDPRMKNNTKSVSDSNSRTHKRSETSSGAFATQLPAQSSSVTSGGKLYSLPSQSLSSPGNINLSEDQTVVPKTLEPARNLRRSTVTLGGESSVEQSTPEPNTTQSTSVRTWASVVSTPYVPSKPEMPAAKTGLRPSSSNGRQNSAESVSSVSSVNKESNANNAVASQAISSNQLKVINIPPRISSSDTTKKLHNQSPLSNPSTMGQEQPTTQSSFAKLVSERFDDTDQSLPPKLAIGSPAQQQLASISKKDSKKEGKPSRLRRAFSFGSAAELRKASAENSHAASAAAAAAVPRKLQKSQYETEEEAREAAIVQRQEASGLGNSIYSGQGNVFSSSTDNLSVSSTASSASIMLRKMGKGVKKGTRSLVGLFRPKSVVGVPAADAAVPEPSLAQVSMVTVEAEREKVNVNLHPSDQTGGGTGFPKLERNSIETGGSEPSLTISDRSSDGVKSRRSIVGSDKDRADILAAVKKGILKRNGTDSGSASPVIKSPVGNAVQLPQVPRFDNTPRSSAPGTPDGSTPRGHRRTDSVTIEGEDYFIGMPRFTGSDSKSLPGTPKSVARNISFSPRIQFHDTWTAMDYDRRGEIATCNRLTPSLAQAIKEELNTFKMEMEVHESSKVYTHFF